MENKMKLNIVTLSSALIVLSFNSVFVHGADTSKKTLPLKKELINKWNQQPTSFAGLSLVTPIEHLPDCPYTVLEMSRVPSIYFLDYKTWKTKANADNTLIACVGFEGSNKPSDSRWEIPSSSYSLQMARDIDPFYGIRVVTIRKKIVTLSANIKSENYQVAKQILIEKFGNQHELVTSSIQSNAGVNFPIETLRWQGDMFSITLQSMTQREYIESLGKTAETGTLTIRDLEFEKSSTEVDRNLIKKKANNL